MNAKGQKAAVCKDKTTVKIQTLLKLFTPAFKNELKESYNKKAIYYHRYQNVLVRISQWSFTDQRKSQVKIEKLPLEIEANPDFYTYEEIEDDVQNFWVEFSGSSLFSDCDRDDFSQSDIIVFQHPLLLSCREYIHSLDKSNFSNKIAERDSVCDLPSPYVFQNIPRWVKTSDSEFSDEFEVLIKEVKSNIISMMAPSGAGDYTKAQLTYLLKTCLVAFGGAIKSAAEMKKRRCIIHTGRWGCGSYGNNEELIYLIQIIAASATGVEKIVFHFPDEEILNAAKERFNDLTFSYYEGQIKVDDLIDSLDRMHFRWQREDIQSQKEKIGLSFERSEEEQKLWERPSVPI